MANGHSDIRIGIFVDNSNIYLNGGSGMRYDVLREFACRDGAEAIRLNTYVSYDAERAEKDSEFESRSEHRVGNASHWINRFDSYWMESNEHHAQTGLSLKNTCICSSQVRRRPRAPHLDFYTIYGIMKMHEKIIFIPLDSHSFCTDRCEGRYDISSSVYARTCGHGSYFCTFDYSCNSFYLDL